MGQWILNAHTNNKGLSQKIWSPVNLVQPYQTKRCHYIWSVPVTNVITFVRVRWTGEKIRLRTFDYWESLVTTCLLVNILLKLLEIRKEQSAEKPVNSVWKEDLVAVVSIVCLHHSRISLCIFFSRIRKLIIWPFNHYFHSYYESKKLIVTYEEECALELIVVKLRECNG